MANLNYELDRTVYGYFTSTENAEQAVRELRDAGFTREQISLAGRPESERLDDITGNTTNAYEIADPREKTDRAEHKAGHATAGFWDRVRTMFEGDSVEPYADETTRGELATHEITGAYDYDPDDFHRSWGNQDATGRSRYFTEQYNRSSDGVLVSVNAEDRRAEAEEILEANGADLGRSYEGDLSTTGLDTDAGATASAVGTSGIDREGYDESPDLAMSRRDELSEVSATAGGNDFGDTTQDRTTSSPQRIQLYGEVLRVHRDRIQRGEVRVRKEVVTEMQSVQVPVSREELVIERVPVRGERTVEGVALGQEAEIRIPLSEEQVSITREPVVREQVEIGKREVTGTETRQEEVRHEELRVDEDTDRFRKAS